MVKALRQIIFTGIDGAAAVYPRGLMKVRFMPRLWGFGPLLTVHSTDPFPATRLYVAVTPDEFRIFSRATMSSPFEIGRWKKGLYRASIRDSGLRLYLDLELEGLGRVSLMSGLRLFARHVRPVFDLVVQGAAGPA